MKILNIWEFSFQRTSAGAWTQPTWSRRHRSVSSSWGPWSEINCHKTYSSTSTAAQSRASWPTAAPFGTPAARQKKGRTSSVWWRQLSGSLALHYHTLMKSTQAASLRKPTALGKTPFIPGIPCSLSYLRVEDWGPWREEEPGWRTASSPKLWRGYSIPN